MFKHIAQGFMKNGSRLLNCWCLNHYDIPAPGQAREMTDMVVLQRADYLQARAAQLGAEVEVANFSHTLRTARS